MSSTVFDTLAYAKRLQAAGVPQAQAEAQAEALAAAVSDQLATKRDIDGLRLEIREIKIELIKWMVGIAFPLYALLIGILLRIT